MEAFVGARWLPFMHAQFRTGKNKIGLCKSIENLTLREKKEWRKGIMMESDDIDRFFLIYLPFRSLFSPPPHSYPPPSSVCSNHLLQDGSFILQSIPISI